MQRRHNCSLASSCAYCVMTLYLLKVHLQTFLSIPITQKCQISRCDSILLGVRSISCVQVFQIKMFHNNMRSCIKAYVKHLNPLNPELNPICYLLALLGANHFLHVSRIRVKSLTFRLLMSYIYMEHLFLM